jgi:tetratricopeptide (TPR) repeat protein
MCIRDSLSVRLIKERVGPVYFLRPGANIVEGDIVFACDTADGNIPCFIVDNAEDNSWQIKNSLSRLRDENKAAIFICGSRINEWRQQSSRFHAKEYVVDSLSESEINKLLECLNRNNELNKLKPLSEDLRKAVIREKHGKELLVVMRESTEDKQFDAIIEDEFFGISDDLCRAIYLTVACFHQHGSFVRQNLLAEIHGLLIDEFHQKIKGKLDGVIIDECIDRAFDQYAYRTRHRTIAQVIWERCGEQTLKNDLLQGSLKHVNLNYRADVSVFEKLIRNDRLIDNLQGLERKIKFFEIACKKDPESPYVRQHYARMFYREGQLDLALTQVDKGIALSPIAPPHVLIHTRGLVLGALALEAKSIDVGRRRLIQAEGEFQKAILNNKKDAYSYQSLGKMYLGWAEKVSSDEEKAAYIQKAEETISEGLKYCKEKDRLWIVSSEIEEWLGNEPTQLIALETAVKDSPGSVIARYLLAKKYRQLNRFDDAINALDPIIKGHQEEFRSFIEYALNMLASGKSYPETIAVLEIPSVIGLSDPRYIAYLGGMYFMSGDSVSAEKIFSETKRRNLSMDDLHTVYFIPRKTGTNNSFELKGKVIIRKSTYSLIESPGFQPFFCHASKYRGLTLSEDMELYFNIGFSPRGAVAINVRKA